MVGPFRFLSSLLLQNLIVMHGMVSRGCEHFPQHHGLHGLFAPPGGTPGLLPLVSNWQGAGAVNSKVGWVDSRVLPAQEQGPVHGAQVAAPQYGILLSLTSQVALEAACGSSR